jgi:L-ascorbate metabolism protein UlaG (beta-lactamase superfamily)
MKVTITHIDTACVLININGFKILTDPTLDKRAFFSLNTLVVRWHSQKNILTRLCRLTKSEKLI